MHDQEKILKFYIVTKHGFTSLIWVFLSNIRLSSNVCRTKILYLEAFKMSNVKWFLFISINISYLN